MKNYLIMQFDMHQKLFNNVLAGFSDAETNQRLDGSRPMNHVKYLAGHLLNSQYGLASIAGLNPKVKWDEMFAVMGRSKAKDDITYPEIQEIKAEWNQMHEKIRSGLEALTIEDLAQKPAPPFDQVAGSVGQLWAFINHHQAYHIGQVGILRRGFGKAPMRYD